MVLHLSVKRGLMLAAFGLLTAAGMFSRDAAARSVFTEERGSYESYESRTQRYTGPTSTSSDGSVFRGASFENHQEHGMKRTWGSRSFSNDSFGGWE